MRHPGKDWWRLGPGRCKRARATQASPPRSSPPPPLREDSFACFLNQLIDHGFQVTGPLIGGQLAVGARAFLQDTIDVLYLLAAAQFVHDVADEPLDQFTNQVAGR